jgi:hypothetical protein
MSNDRDNRNERNGYPQLQRPYQAEKHNAHVKRFEIHTEAMVHGKDVLFSTNHKNTAFTWCQLGFTVYDKARGTLMRDDK